MVRDGRGKKQATRAQPRSGGATSGHEAELWSSSQSGDGADAYEDLPGFCKSTPLGEVRRHGHVLISGRYVGAEPQPDDGECTRRRWSG